MSFFDKLFKLGYANDLHQQLKGLSADCEGYSGVATYQLTSIVLLATSLVVMLNYYYGLFNNPRYTHRRTWLINVLAAATISGGFAYYRAARFLPELRHCPDMHFSVIDCTLFAFTSVIYAVIVCIIFSLLLKWKSVANKKIPF